MQDQGARREQQDCYCLVLGALHKRPALLAVVADGMGGMRDGAAFSRIVVDYHRKHFQTALYSGADAADILLALAIGANKEANTIFDPQKPGGTTLISALFTGDYVYTLSVGDSRIYLFRKNTQLDRFLPLQLNREHTLGVALDERAWQGQIPFEDAREIRYRDTLTAALGPEMMRKIDLIERPIHLLSGDKIALMSDGVFRALTDEELAADMTGSPEEASERICCHVIGKKLPEQDNMSIVIVER